MQTTGKILVSQAECTYLKKLKAWFAPKLQSSKKRKTSHTCLYYTTHTCGTRLIQCKCRLAVPQCNKYSDIWNIRRMYSLIWIPEQLMMFIWWRKCSTWATCLYTVSLRLLVKLMHLGALSAFWKFHPCLPGWYFTSHKQKLTTLITAFYRVLSQMLKVQIMKNKGKIFANMTGSFVVVSRVLSLAPYLTVFSSNLSRPPSYFPKWKRHLNWPLC